MNKQEVIDLLTQAEIKHDPTVNKAELEALLPDELKKTSSPEKVTVYCGKQPLFEDGQRYEPGDPIETTPARAKALGKTVTEHNPR